MTFVQFLNPITLSFKDKKLEQEFSTYYKLSVVKHVRFSLILSVGLYLGFAILDALLYPDFKDAFHFIRFVVVAPSVLLVIAYTRFSSNLKYLQVIVSICALIGAYGIIAMIYIGGEAVSTVYYVGLSLVFIFNYDFIRLRFLPATFVGLLTLIGYFYVSVHLEISYYQLVGSLFFLTAANIIGMGSAYYFEILSRKNFHYNLLLEQEKDKTANINNELERQVKERTANLEKANKELTIALLTAEESERLKSVFLATMSHELRTPLNAIIGFSQFIGAENNDPEEDKEFAQIINNSGHHLLEIIESLLDITLIESGQIKVKKSEFLLIELLADVNTIIRQEQVKLEKEDIKIYFDPAKISSDLNIFSDKYKIKQVLLNLLKNALKFTEKGEIRFWCEQISLNGKPFLKFYVSDTGIGIKEEKKDLIFDVFRQADDTSTRKHGGVGIGLTIVHKLVNIMGGEVWVDSVEGKGSTFYFTIADYEIMDLPEIIISEAIYGLPKALDKKILVVEDDPPSFYLLEVLLGKMGFNVTWAQNGQIALDMLAENQMFDLILMDMNMPVLNGYNATEKIKKLFPENIIIAQTAYAVYGDKEKAFAVGCDDYISKPISAKNLEELISRYFVL